MDLEAQINTYIVESDAIEQSRLAAQIAKAPLLRTIKCLEDPLTQEDAQVRATATQCLTDVIKHSPALSAAEIKVLSAFLGDRLQDSDSARAAAHGLTALLAKPQFYASGALPDTLGRFADLDMLRADADTRLAVYEFFDAAARADLGGREAAVPEIAKRFVAVASGEKDPRNLMLSLQISAELLARSSSSSSSDLPRETRAELYDITFCYFPVKFNPPKDMPYKITAEEIKERLKQTIASPGLTEWVVPGLISKLAAVSVTVKLDALDALDLTLQKQQQQQLQLQADSGENALRKLWPPIWEGVKFEVLHGTPESETYGPSLRVLSRFSEIPDFQEAVLREFDDVERMSSSKLCQLCCTVIGVATSESVWNALVPRAIEKCYSNLTALILFLNSPFGIPHLDQVFQRVLEADASQNKEAVIGLKRVALSPNGGEYVPLIVDMLTTKREYGILGDIAEVNPSAVGEHCIPQLLAEFPNPTVMHAVAQICRVQPLVFALTEQILPRLSPHNDPEGALVLLLALVEASKNLTTAPKTTDNGAGTASIDRNTITSSSSSSSSSSNELLLGYNELVSVPVMRAFANFKNTSQVSYKLLVLACILLERASRGVQPARQSEYTTQMLEFMDKTHFHLVFSSLVAMPTFPFSVRFISDTVVPELEAMGSSSSTTTNDTPCDALLKTAYMRMLSVAANKWTKDAPELNETLTQYSFPAEASAASAALPTKLNVYIAITRGLLLKTEKLGFDHAMLLTKLATHNISVADAFGILLAPDRTLIRENGCIARPLYRQRLFLMSLPELSLAGTSTFESLVAVSSLLKYSPQTVVKASFNKIFPLLLSSLNTPSEQIQETAIQTITAALPECGPSIEPKLDLLIPVLLKIGRQAKLSTARAAAFRALCALRQALGQATDGFREVIKEDTKHAVGDANRDVRRYAVKCRQLQF